VGLAAPSLRKLSFRNADSHGVRQLGRFSNAQLVFGYFFVPVLEGQSLEALDLIEASVPARKFRDFHITTLRSGEPDERHSVHTQPARSFRKPETRCVLRRRSPTLNVLGS